MTLRSVALLILLFAALPAQAFSLLPSGPVVEKMGEIELTLDQLKELIQAQTPEVRQTLLASRRPSSNWWMPNCCGGH